MRVLLAALFGLLAAGETLPPCGVVRATLLVLDGDADGGELVLRAASGRIFLFYYDSKTVFESGRKQIAATALDAGNPVEAVTNRRPGRQSCYARTLRLLESGGSLDPRLRPLPEWVNPTEDLFPRGDLTYTGVVCQVAPGRLVLRLRGGGQENVLLRPDTRFLRAGAPAKLGDLEVNTRVFVRAGTNLDGRIEAYRVIWGKILKVR